MNEVPSQIWVEISETDSLPPHANIIEVIWMGALLYLRASLSWPKPTTTSQDAPELCAGPLAPRSWLVPACLVCLYRLMIDASCLGFALLPKAWHLSLPTIYEVPYIGDSNVHFSKPPTGLLIFILYLHISLEFWLENIVREELNRA